MATQRVPPMEEGQHHHVQAADNGQVDKPTVHAYKSAGHRVMWHSRKPARIAFESPDGSPFTQTSFQVAAGGSVSSGPIRKDAKEEKEYKYTVYGVAGKNDPTVIIHN